MSNKPVYLVRLNKEGYYSPDTEMPVSKERAERLSHKEANKVSNHVKRFYKSASMEPFNKELT